MNLISLENLSVFSYANGAVPQAILKNVSIAVAQCELIHLVCANLEQRNLLGALLKGCLQSGFQVTGTVEVNGQSIDIEKLRSGCKELKVACVGLRMSSLKSSQIIAEQLWDRDQLRSSTQPSSPSSNNLLHQLSLDKKVLCQYPSEMATLDRVKIQVMQGLLLQSDLLIVDGLEILPVDERQILIHSLQEIVEASNLSMILWHNNREQIPRVGRVYFLEGAPVALPHKRTDVQSSFLWT